MGQDAAMAQCTLPLSMYSPETRIKSGSETSSASALSSNLWYQLAKYSDLATLGRLLGCNSQLLGSVEVRELWKYQTFLHGLARPIFTKEWVQDPFPEDIYVDWRGLLRSAAQNRGSTSVWIRTFNIDLRVSIPSIVVVDPLSALLRELDWLVRISWGPATLSSRSAKKRGQFERHSGCNRRLRQLQWAGRPGPLFQGPLMDADHLLLEWALPNSRSWLLPPRSMAPNSAASRLSRFSHFMNWHGESQTRCPVLIRLISTPSGSSQPLQSQIWITVDLATSSLHYLFQRILEVLPSYSRPAQLHLMDTKLPEQEVKAPKEKLLREFGWAHSETLCLQFDQSSGKGIEAMHILVHREIELARSTTLPVAMCEGGDADATRASMGTAAELASPSDMSTPNKCPLLAKFTPAVARTCVPKQETSEDGGQSLPIMRLPFARDPLLGFASCERVVPHFPPRIFRNQQQIRQFEFHPSLSDVVLLGDKEGGVNVMRIGETDKEEDEENCEEQPRPPLIVDPSSQVLSLAWLRHHPQIAACGLANSGRISIIRYTPSSSPWTPALHYVASVGAFSAFLSSLSINCTDDFLLASGSSNDVAIYDMQTGKVIQNGLGVHSSMINISRFAHCSPHIFSTASIDHTCKLWDLRQPVVREGPVKVLRTRGPNVMCTFSPDDSHILCSGVADGLEQFEVPSFRRTPVRFPLGHSPHAGPTRYRRSMYLATGRHFVTGTTEESRIRVLSVQGDDLGTVDFRTSRPLQPGPFGSSSQLVRRLGASVFAAPPSRPPGRWAGRSDGEGGGEGGQGPVAVSSVAAAGHGLVGERLQRAMGRERPRLAHESGTLVDCAMPEPSLGPQGVSVQSVKAHPVVENRVGVLLKSDVGGLQSYVALLHLGPNYSGVGN
mmetsp:Transcript_43802/g.93169  ORF Transcript_43802/g.93169 Transcript_43802/m.93169 type:complete len:894 (+) Transcript_43802:144-2825(+)